MKSIYGMEYPADFEKLHKKTKLVGDEDHWLVFDTEINLSRAYDVSTDITFEIDQNSFMIGLFMDESGSQSN